MQEGGSAFEGVLGHSAGGLAFESVRPMIAAKVLKHKHTTEPFALGSPTLPTKIQHLQTHLPHRPAPKLP